MANPQARKSARKLRSEGKSIKEIASLLKVSPGSVSLWCRDIILNDEQIQELQRRTKDPNYGKRAIYLNKVKEETANRIARLKEEGKVQIGHLSAREQFVAGVALYWAEGFKKDKQIGFTNMDPQMILFFLGWLTECLGVKKEDIKLRVTINQSYADQIHQVEEYWSKLTHIPVASFQKAMIQKVIWKKDYENKDLYKGVLRIRVAKSLPALRRIFGSIEGIYFNSPKFS